MNTNYFLKRFLVIAFFGMLITSASAQLMLNENFNGYTGNLESQPTWDWMNAQGTLPIQVEAGAYSYTDYPTSGTGNKVIIGATGEDLYRTFPKKNIGSVYAAFLVQVSAATTSGEYFFGFSPNPIDKTIYHGRVYVKKDASNNIAFGVTRVTGTVLNYSSFTYALNTPYLIVLKYDIVTGTGNDVCSITVNPVIASGEAGATWLTTSSADTGSEAGSLVGAVALRQSAATTAVKVSNIRVAGSWTDLMDAGATINGLVLNTDDGVKTGFAATTSAPSAAQTFTVSGTGLTADIIITQAASSNVKYFELSADDINYSDNLTLTQSEGSVAPTTVYIRMKSQASAVTGKNNYFNIISTGVNPTALKATGDVTVSTGLNAVNASYNITKLDNGIAINGLKANQTVEIYNSLGQLQHSAISSTNNYRYRTNYKGIAFVKIGNYTAKVIL